MSSLVDSSEYSTDYDLGDHVWFKDPYDLGGWWEGEIARVYSSGYDFHVEHNGSRYFVTRNELSRTNPEV